MNSRPPIVGVIVVAAGSGTRLGADRPKAFVGLAGRTVLDNEVTLGDAKLQIKLLFSLDDPSFHFRNSCFVVACGATRLHALVPNTTDAASTTDAIKRAFTGPPKTQGCTRGIGVRNESEFSLATSRARPLQCEL